MWKWVKRRPVLVALLIAVTGLAVARSFLPYGGRVTRANCEGIDGGMTEAEVRTVLGKPWDDSMLDPEAPAWRIEWRDRAWKYSRQWVGDDCEIIVMFDDEDRVVHRVFFPNVDRPNSSLPARVWRRLHARYGW
jgi:hypothetical protein